MEAVLSSETSVVYHSIWYGILPEDGGNMFLRNLRDHLQVVWFHIPDDHKFSKLLAFSQKT
jgi:hypothetical protein